MRVLAVDPARELALCVDEGGRRHTVDTGIAGAVAPGDRLLVHAGAALLKESA
jgi:hydrogenase maturation factor